RHEYESGKIIKAIPYIIEFYEELLSQGATLRNKDILIKNALANDEVLAQLTAADAFSSYHKQFMTMLKSHDVLSVGPYINNAFQFLQNVDKNNAREILNGEKTLFNSEFLRTDGKKLSMPVGAQLLSNSQNIIDRAIDYLISGCNLGATALRKISQEYFEEGIYYSPTPHMISMLSGKESHSDRNESNLGQYSQQRQKEPSARWDTINSKVAMRANKTINKVRKNQVLQNAISLTRKLERKYTTVTIKKHLKHISEKNKPHRQAKLLIFERQKLSRENREKRLANAISSDGKCVTKGQVDLLLKNKHTLLDKKFALKSQINYIKASFYESVEFKSLFTFSERGRVHTILKLKDNLIELLGLVYGDKRNIFDVFK
ncbi:unnamed protein product, partial [Owenia fusiformis]